jgi:hypothetical protein
MEEEVVAVRDLFSKRRARETGEAKDVFQYEVLPQEFRVQVVQIAFEALGNFNQAAKDCGMSHPSNDFWISILKTMLREKGQFFLSQKAGPNPVEQCMDYIMTAPTGDALDIIEVIFSNVDGVRSMHPFDRQHFGLSDPNAAIAELNARFREHGIGYQFALGKIVRVDSQYLHVEAVKPALELLHGAGGLFSGPLEEFLKAHEKYRKGEGKEAITDAGKAFESTMKAICTARKCPYDHKANASDLIKIIFENGLIPPWMQSQFTALRSLLESGPPTPRNKVGAHGQGPVPVNVPEHLVRYALNLAASNIVFLIESHNAQK